MRDCQRAAVAGLDPSNISDANDSSPFNYEPKLGATELGLGDLSPLTFLVGLGPPDQHAQPVRGCGEVSDPKGHQFRAA